MLPPTAVPAAVPTAVGFPTPVPAAPAAPRRRTRLPSPVVTAAVAVLVVAFTLAGVGAGGAVLIGFVILTPIERRWRRHDQPVRRPGLRTDVVHLLLTNLLTTAMLLVPLVLWAVALTPVLRFGPAPTFQSLPGPLQAVLGFLGLELLGYFAHRLEHEIPWLWRFHAVHHSSARLDWIAGARLHPFEGLIVGSILVPPLIWIGVQPGTLGAITVFTQLWGVLHHMNVRWRMRPIRRFWSTPDFHHWHHSNHPEAHNTNYSGFLPFLDRIFGTEYQPDDRRPEIYGIDEAMPDGWWAQLAHPFRRRTRAAVATGA